MIYSKPQGRGSIKVGIGYQRLSVYAYTAKPLLPIVELVADSVSVIDDQVFVQPTTGFASTVQLSDQVSSNYPTPFLTNMQAQDQMRLSITMRIADDVFPVDDNSMLHPFTLDSSTLDGPDVLQ